MVPTMFGPSKFGNYWHAYLTYVKHNMLSLKYKLQTIHTLVKCRLTHHQKLRCLLCGSKMVIVANSEQYLKMLLTDYSLMSHISIFFLVDEKESLRITVQNEIAVQP